jgi:hypothetical protein
VGPRAVLDTMVKRKIPSPRRESNKARNLLSSFVIVGFGRRALFHSFSFVMPTVITYFV